MGFYGIINQKNPFEAKTIEELLPKYVCHRCVNKVLEYNRKGTFGGEIIFMTIMFVDIHGFTQIYCPSEEPRMCCIQSFRYRREPSGFVSQPTGLCDSSTMNTYGPSRPTALFPAMPVVMVER